MGIGGTYNRFSLVRYLALIPTAPLAIRPQSKPHRRSGVGHDYVDVEGYGGERVSEMNNSTIEGLRESVSSVHFFNPNIDGHLADEDLAKLNPEMIDLLQKIKFSRSQMGKDET